MANIKEFQRAIEAGDASNPTVAPSVRSNLTCVLGREAARCRRELTWEELLKENRKIDGKLEGLVN